MNIFALDLNPSTAARYHCDKHVVKMLVETAQLLSTAWFITNPDQVTLAEGIWALRGQRICRPSHSNHPCAVWARATNDNYVWLHALGLRLSEQYTKRYGKQHALHLMLTKPLAAPPESLASGLTPHAQAMPDFYKCPDAIDAYRMYYVGEKLRFARWRFTERPYWLDEYIARLDKIERRQSFEEPHYRYA